MEKKKFGDEGENVALRHLQEKGYKLLDRNWYYKKKEIDIIMEDKDKLVIVEVKTRNTEYFESPNEMVKRRKQRYLIEAADAYVMKKDIDKETRFDVVIVIMKDGKAEINHIQDAFQPSLL